MTDTTAILVKRWTEGDREALADLLQRNLAWVRNRVRQRIGRELRTQDESQDVVQEVVLELLEAESRIEVRDRDHFRRLLTKIIENTLRQRARYLHSQKRDRRNEKQIASDTVLGQNPPQREVTRPSMHASKNESVAWIRLALLLLDPADQAVVDLHHVQGKSFPEVGAALGMSAEAARTRFRRALPRLVRKVTALRAGREAGDS